jgi:bacterioferritin-associated ferredoxin
MKIDEDNMASPLDKLPPSLKEDLDKNLCTCMDVPRIDIINAIVNGATTVDEVKKQTYAGKGSGCCIQQIERLIACLCTPEPVKRRNRRKWIKGA